MKSTNRKESNPPQFPQFISSAETEEDAILNISLRPRSITEFIGQKDIIENLSIAISAAKKRSEPLEHILFSGPPGLGKCINKDSIVFTEKGMLPLYRLGDLSKHGFQRNEIKIYSLSGPQITSHFYNNSKSKVIKIKTHQGYELEGTPNHPIIILNDGKMEFALLEKIKIGDYVAIQRGHDYFGNITEISKFNFIKDRGNTYNYDKYTTPTSLTPQLARICGYLIGDGYVGRTSEICFNNDDSQILTDFQSCWFVTFGKEPKICYPKDRCPVIRIKNFKIRKFFIHIGIPYAKAGTKSVPFSIMSAPKEIVKEFLKGLFECDGHIRPNCRQIDISSASEQLIKEVQIILLNFGIISRTYKDLHKKEGVAYYRLYITGEDVDIFKREIGFISDKKSKAQDGFSAKFNTNKDLVPYGKGKLREMKKILIEINDYLDKKSYRRTAKQEASSKEINECLNRLENRLKEVLIEIENVRLISNPKIFWDKIILKEDGFNHTVDVTVPSNHTFFANGFINHNTSLAHIIAHEMSSKLTATSGPAIERAGDLIGILTNLEESDVLFIDEIHRLSKVVEEFLYPAMESFQIDFVIDKGPYARTIKFNLKRFTLIGATTRSGLLSSPLRGRFGIFYHLNFYNCEELVIIIKRSAKILEMSLNDEAANLIASRARGSPRVANRLLRRVRDWAQVKGDGKITPEVATNALYLQGIDIFGLDALDRRVLKTMIESYGGGPVGIESLAASLSEEPDTVVDIVEPYLLSIGFLKRTPRGRKVTALARRHFSELSSKESELFKI